MPDPFTAALRDWQPFYEVTGESSATLTGLMFVAVTVGARFLTAATLPIVRTLVSPTLGYFTSALVLSAVMLVPTQTRPELAGELGAFGLVGLYRLGALLLNMRRLHRRLSLERRYWATQVALPTVSHLCLFAAAGGLWLGRSTALAFPGASVLLLIVVGVVNAWEVTLHSIAVSPEEIAAIESAP